MLGSILRLKIAIVLAVLGLLVLGTGIGQRTIWLPPATLTAAVSPDVKAAPLTVIGSDLLKTRDGRFTLRVKNDGPIQLAVARASLDGLLTLPILALAQPATTLRHCQPRVLQVLKPCPTQVVQTCGSVRKRVPAS